MFESDLHILPELYKQLLNLIDVLPTAADGVGGMRLQTFPLTTSSNKRISTRLIRPTTPTPRHTLEMVKIPEKYLAQTFVDHIIAAQ